MSIYRRTDRVPLNDFQPESHTRPASVASVAEVAWAKRRTTDPATGLLKPTFAWASTLPIEIQPRTLLYMFPRIANLMAAMWQDPNSLRGYVDDLLVDRRGNRQGFPLEVLHELFKLRAYYDELHPGDAVAWDREAKKQ